MEKYTAYCTCFYADGTICFFDEIKNKQIGKVKTKSKEEADQVMRIWKENAPKNVICDIIS